MPPVTPEQLASLPPEYRALLESVIDYYEARLAELESQLGKTPRNSSLPPSSRHPHAGPPPEKPKGERKRGGQPGHKRNERPLKPTDECDDVRAHKPTACRGCGMPLAGDDPEPLRHQVWELPEVKPHVTEHRRHRLTCRCGVTTCAPLPVGVPSGQAGPRLVALAALLMGCFRQSKRRTALFLQTILGQPCSTGWVVKLQDQATAAVRPAYDELAGRLPGEPFLSMDETPTKQGGAKSWLWTYVAKDFTLFSVRPSRGATGVTDLLGDGYQGVVHCDRARMYLSLPRLQWCWAHLKRDFQALIDSGEGQAKRLGHDLMRPVREMFRLWGRVRDPPGGGLTRLGFKRLMRPVRDQVEALLLRGAYSGNRRLVGMCRELYDHRDRLWRFVEVDGVEPTNNASERALRHAVIWRKLSFGTQSAAGSRFVETLLTAVETCRQQDRGVLGYLTNAVERRLAGLSAPSLLPGA